jgi:hypothetical protein
MGDNIVTETLRRRFGWPPRGSDLPRPGAAGVGLNPGAGCGHI